MNRLVIDDLRILGLPGKTIYARNLEQAFAALAKRKKWDEVWLDHDLGMVDGREQDIWPIVGFFEQRAQYDPIQIANLYIITSNPVGAQRMKLALDNIGYSAMVLNARHVLEKVLPW